MNTTDNIVLDKIKYLCNVRSWTMYKLAKESSIPYSNLNNILNRNTIPSIPTLQKICTGLGITLETFFCDDKFRDNTLSYSDSLNSSEARLIGIYRDLNEHDKEFLLTYAMGLNKEMPKL